MQHKISQLRVSIAGRLIHRFLPYRRRVVMANMERVFGDTLSKSDKVHLAKAFYSHLATSIKETLQLRFMSEQAMQTRVDVIGAEHMLAVVAKGRGVLVLTGHFGSWEYAPIVGISNFKEYKGQFHFIRKKIGIKWLERLLFRRFYQAGLNVIPKKNSLSLVCDALEKNHAVIFVLDQHATLKNKDGVAVEFFNKKAGTYRSLASLSQYTGIPVVPASSHRLPNGRHVLKFHEPIPWTDYGSSQESIYRNTLAYNQALERIILEHPEQWMWFHKRWKLRDG